VIAIAGEVEHGLAHRLARDSSGIDAAAAENFTALNQCNLLAALAA